MGTHGSTFDYNLIKDIYSEDTDNGRFYIVGDKRYPSVTTVLSQGNKNFLTEWRERVGEKEADKITKQAAIRGSAVHEMAEHYLKTKTITKDNPLIYSIFLPLKDWIDKNIQSVIALEIPLFSHKLKMAGRVDCIAVVNNKLCIIDFKTSMKRKKKEWIENYHLQCTAYSVFYYEMFGERIDNFHICITEECSNVPNIFSDNPSKYAKKLIDIRKEFKI